MQETILKRIAGMNYYYRYYTIDYFFDSLKKNHIQNFELWTCTHHFELSDMTYQETKKFKKKIDQYGLHMICLTPEQSNPKPYNLAAKEPQLQEKAKRYFMNAIRVASELDCKQLSLNSGWDFYSENPNEAWKRSVSMMNELAEFARKNNVTIVLEALQPDESHLVNTINDLTLYLEAVNQDNLFVNIDFGAMARAHETIDQYFLAFGEKIRHCHFVDGKPTGHLAWGDGNRDILTDFNDLIKNGYLGWLTFEFANSSYFNQPFETDRRVIQHIKNMIH
ncbi:sugar phosphate isomerase/epimerase family protein [Vagococcus acidifermentans]|uniref:Xylose isomerase-like TIM barrel domain-containing protein n=1 Tax=Vagococcus acidifermentans TaxID=564710 RepID=A0A430AMH5_9ENTE|nr:sugar phosphate isomerase/epimerase family protein [Vagococcus acidifermentans]RSU09107.1 hypothetical protein CBF27_13465 [Vagococcus acidifermentans]